MSHRTGAGRTGDVCQQTVILSKDEGAQATEAASKDPEDVCSSMLMQGVLPSHFPGTVSPIAIFQVVLETCVKSTTPPFGKNA
jgi:hypothetical protein